MKKLTSLLLAIVFAVSVALAVINTANSSYSENEEDIALLLTVPMPKCKQCK